MPTPRPPILIGLLAVLLVTGGQCTREPSPSDSPPAAPSASETQTPADLDTALTSLPVPDGDADPLDAFQGARQQFNRRRPPTAADSLVLHRWGDSLAADGRSLLNRAPAEARTYLRAAVRAYRALADSAEVGEAIGDIGVTYFFQSQYDRAKRKYQHALSIHRDLGDRDEVADNLGNIGITHWSQGRYDQALAQYRASLRIKRDIEDRPGIARSRANIGLVHYNQGRYDRALSHFQNALAIYRDLGNRKGVARTLNNIALIYKDQGQYERALSGYRSSLEVERELNNRRGIAASLNNIGNMQQKQGRYEAALSSYRESLQLKRDLGDRKGIANSLSSIGSIQEKQGRNEEALTSYRSALRIRREIGDREGRASDLSKLGRLRRSQGRLEAAQSHFQESLRINRTLGKQARLPETLESIGAIHLETGSSRAAIDSLRRAVQLAEDVRRNATSPEAKRTLLATQIGAYQALATANVRSGRPDSALRAVERARARLLTDRLAGVAQQDTSFTVPSAKALRRTLAPEETALLYANTGPERPLTVLVVRRDTTYARERPDTEVRRRIGQTYPSRLRQLQEQNGPLTGMVNDEHRGSPETVPSLSEAIRLYRSALTRGDAGDSLRRPLAERLHDLLIGPLRERLQDTETVTVVPAGALGYLPFEALRRPDGTYFIEQNQVRYAQSLTVLRQLQGRNYAERSRPLLALGGARYSGGAPTGAPLLADSRRVSSNERDEQFPSLFRAAVRRMDRGESPRSTYARLGYDQWPTLYGTDLEVQKLSQALEGRATLLTGPAASEQRVRQMSASGELARYRRIHFATHGLTIPEAPALSALVLSQDQASDSLAAADGYLTMEEIADLNLRADVAVLSACRTGLGRLIAGEGVVSLSHAFMRAGANATLVSQWRVLDWSTQQFMTAVYRKVHDENLSFAEATTEVKREFLAGAFGEQNTDPLRWAPFVYYGRK